MIGRTYRRRYGYSWPQAIAAELWWRLEHVPLAREGQPFERLAVFAYGRRKAAERSGIAARNRGTAT